MKIFEAIRKLSVGSVIVAALLPSALAAEAGRGTEIDIPYERFVLDNGLTLIVHEDHKAPIVAVNVWYHVGSKNEKPGRTGFAHLFEHLMFNGSENFDDDYFQVLERVGATDLNGTTNEDRTNYFQNVPTSALDLVLWMESDRMGHLLEAVTQAKLDEQRGVVQNEKRQGENQPYAVSRELIANHVFPAGHPYSWTVIGSMEDLDAAKLEDVHEWFKSYYGAANAVIVLAGDIDPETARSKVERYFGDIPSGPPVARPEAWIARRSGTVRQTVQDRVPHSRVYKVWNVPQWGTRDHDDLELLADVLASGKTSRLYHRLVYDEQIARDVRAYVDSREIAGLFMIVATAQPDADAAKVERAIDEELARLLEQGPTQEELGRVRTQYVAGFVRGIERIGGFGGKSDILARNEVYGGSPGYYKTMLGHVRSATPERLHDVARRWLSDGEYVLTVLPFPKYKTHASNVDRSKLPEPEEPPAASFVELQRGELSNGLELVLAERHATPLVEFRLLVDAGYAADQFASPGTAQLAMDMLDEGTASRDALKISEELAALGAELGSGSNLDQSTVTLSALKAKLEPSLELFADVVLHPSFPAKEFERLRKEQLARIEAEKARPIQMALRVFPGLLYGSGHAYGTPFTGSGTAESVTKLKREDLVRFHETWFRPNNATLVIVGDTTMARIRPQLERLFRDWERGTTPRKNIASVHAADKPQVYLIDKPGAQQSVILAGHVAPPRGVKDNVAIETMNSILGGTFISRLNLNLREDKHWAYGAGSFLVEARGQRPFVTFAPVQTDKTKESMLEVFKELQGIRGERPITSKELDVVKDNQILQLPGSWETNNAVASSIAEIVRFDLDDRYFDRYPDEVRKLSLEQVASAARETIHPDSLVWVVVGDREKIEPGIRELGWGEPRLLDPDASTVRR